MSSYVVTDKNIENAQKGRLDKVNRALRAVLSNMGRDDARKFERVYYRKKEDAEKAAEKSDSEKFFFNKHKKGKNEYGIATPS